MASKYSEAGKGSTTKLKQKKQFDNGWDKIWGSKENHKEDNIFFDSDESTDWDYERIEIISQNGNSGTHYFED
jgi:hypothetical protein